MVKVSKESLLFKESNASKKKFFRIPHIYRVLNLINWDPGGSRWVRDAKQNMQNLFLDQNNPCYHE
jgi:hypothetical protein